jgi:predicted membrane channel-forming protein YqfA (hemolysin III family)
MKLRALIVPFIMAVAIAGPTVISLLFPNVQTEEIGILALCWGVIWVVIGSVLYNFLYPSPTQRYSDYDPSTGVTINFNSTLPLYLGDGKHTIILSIVAKKELWIGDDHMNGSGVTSDGGRDYADLLAGYFNIARVGKGYRVTWKNGVWKML